MFCPSCGKENAQSFGYCNHCGRELTPPPSRTPGADPTAASAPAPAPYPSATPALFEQAPPRKKSNAPLIIGICLLIVAAGVGWVLTHRAQIGRMFDNEAPDQLVGRLMREAAGVQPVHESFFSDRDFDDAFRDQFRKIIHLNQEFMGRLKQIDMSQIGRVGTPESFADPEYAAEGIRQFHASFDLERELEQRLKDIVVGIKQTFEKASLSESERAAALRGFDQGFATAMERRTRIINAEQSYATAMDDMYKFTGDHHADIQVVSGRLQIRDDAVRESFNSKIRAYNARREEFLRAKQEFDRAQSDTMNKMGVTRKDTGLQ